MTTQRSFKRPLSSTTRVSQYQNVSTLDLTAAKDDGDGGDSWSYKTCKAPVKSSPPTNQHPVLLQAGCPSCHPTNSIRALKKIIITFHRPAHPKLTTWSLPTLFVTTEGSWLPRDGCQASHLPLVQTCRHHGLMESVRFPCLNGTSIPVSYSHCLTDWSWQ